MPLEGADGHFPPHVFALRSWLILLQGSKGVSRPATGSGCIPVLRARRRVCRTRTDRQLQGSLISFDCRAA